MLKNILKLEGAQKLTRVEQKNINGGVTQECNSAINSGQALFKGSKPCPIGYGSSGGCCWSLE